MCLVCLVCDSHQTSIVINHIDNILLIEERLVWRPKKESECECECEI